MTSAEATAAALRALVEIVEAPWQDVDTRMRAAEVILALATRNDSK